jgi:hypothetical protein
LKIANYQTEKKKPGIQLFEIQALIAARDKFNLEFTEFKLLDLE